MIDDTVSMDFPLEKTRVVEDGVKTPHLLEGLGLTESDVVCVYKNRLDYFVELKNKVGSFFLSFVIGMNEWMSDWLIPVYRKLCRTRDRITAFSLVWPTQEESFAAQTSTVIRLSLLPSFLALSFLVVLTFLLVVYTCSRFLISLSFFSFFWKNIMNAGEVGVQEDPGNPLFFSLLQYCFSLFLISPFHHQQYVAVPIVVSPTSTVWRTTVIPFFTFYPHDYLVSYPNEYSNVR